MRFRAGLYEVLSNDEARFVHGNSEQIQTSNVKNVWLKDLTSQEVFNVSLKDSAVPVKSGAKIGLGFFNGEVIAFKRRDELPVEDPVSMKHWHNPIIAVLWAIFFGILMSIPLLGYFAGFVSGGVALITGMNLLGRYSKFMGNRIFAAFLLFMSCYAALQYRKYALGTDALVNSLTAIAVALTLGIVLFQLYKIRVEKRYFKRAVSEINAAWKS